MLPLSEKWYLETTVYEIIDAEVVNVAVFASVERVKKCASLKTKYVITNI